MNNSDTLPLRLREVLPCLLAKRPQTEIPQNYRPITCLIATYNILISIITKGIKKVILENCKNSQRNIITSNLQKAFGSVSHDWIITNPQVTSKIILIFQR